MSSSGSRNEILLRALFILALLLSFEPLYPQYTFPKDTSIRVSKGSFIRLKEKNEFVVKDTIIKITGTLIPATVSRKNKTMAFYDSLKAKVSKSTVAKALFDLVIVSPDTLSKKKIINRSDESFKDYSGIRIRKIRIQRLDAFGVSIDNPGYYHPNGIEKVLNSTHINTNENIVRKNLLFSEGDTISPLKLTDNERILRNLSFINDARIIVVPVSDVEADIVVITKDVYSLGGSFTYRDIGKGSVWLFEKNLLGMGHEFKLEIPYSSDSPDSPGVGLTYNINNISKTFVNLSTSYYNGLGKRTYGFTLSRNLVSSETKWGAGVSIRQMYTTEDLDTLPKPEPLSWNFQDYWLLRSFLINRESVTRIILGLRYNNNNVFERPYIKPDTYYPLQRYKIFLGSVTFSRQKYYKANLIYNYGRTEDIPYGGLIRFTGGIEDNELNKRGYLGADAAIGKSIPVLGYFYGSTGLGAFFTKNNAKQGVLSVAVKYFSNIMPVGRQKIRNFINIDYTRGFDRNADEYLSVLKNNGFTSFNNDSLRGTQRLKISLESVAFTPLNPIGFRFAVFGFADMALLAGQREVITKGSILSCIGLGIRIRNDNLVFNTFQIKFGFFFSPPQYSKINYITFSGEQLLTPNNFDPVPPSPLPYR